MPETPEQWLDRVTADMPPVPDHTLSPSPVTSALLRDLHVRVTRLEARTPKTREGK